MAFIADELMIPFSKRVEVAFSSESMIHLQYSIEIAFVWPGVGKLSDVLQSTVIAGAR